MRKLIKTDFHLHTLYSDNRDRMTPEEYAELAKRAGYAAIGFCDHNHNLTQEGWQALAAAALTTPDLLLTTGYEATFWTGHLCLLNRPDFDGESAVECEQQMWRPDNLRIVAHPDNNGCAWRLPLPVHAAGVEVINSGHDLYSFRPTSECNGLHTYQTYLLLNHPVAAFAQSDCHARVMFGHVWTGMWLPEDAPVTWPAIRSAIAERRVFAARGDISLRVWSEEDAQGRPVLRWEASPGAAITVYCGDRPMTYLDPVAAARGSHAPATNGYYWLLAQRGLTWAVSSPVAMQPQPADHPQVAARRAALLADPLVQHQSDRLRRRLDHLTAFAADWRRSLFPVHEYMDWLTALLPDHWQPGEFVDGADELQRRARLRLEHAETLAAAVLDDLIRQEYRDRPDRPEGVQVVVAAPHAGQTGGPVQFTVEVPRDWADVTLVDASGAELNYLGRGVDGERDPFHSPRTRAQLGEIVTWLRHGEMHEYGLRHVSLTRTGSRLAVQFDLYPAKLLDEVVRYPELAAELEQHMADPSLTDFHVHTRMPKRFALLLQIDRLPTDGCLPVLVRPGPGDHARTLSGLDENALSVDLLADGLVVQISI